MANNEEITLHVSENSPYVIGARAYVEQTENGAVITIIDKEGTTTATVSNGKGIASATLNEDYTLTLIYTDGTSVTTTSIRGEKGESGVYCGSTEPSNPDVDVWIDPTGDPYPMEDEITEAVDEWITAHPEYVTTVQDGAITVPKFAAGVVDTGLNKVGYPADSKATGDAIAADRTRLTAVEGEADALDARITNLAQLTDGSTTGDAELMDARVVGSTTYSTLHEAIDTEFTNVKSDKADKIGYKQINELNTDFFTVGDNRYNLNDVTDGVRLNQDSEGTFADASFTTSGFIYVDDLTSVKFYRRASNGTQYNDTAYYVLYDANKQRLGSRQLASSVDVSSAVWMRVSNSLQYKSTFMILSASITPTSYIPFAYTFDYFEGANPKDTADKVAVLEKQGLIQLINSANMTLGKYYEHNTNVKVSSSSAAILSAIRIYKGVKYSFEDLYAYFCNILYDGSGSYEALSSAASPDLQSGKFTAEENGYIYVTLSVSSDVVQGDPHLYSNYVIPSEETTVIKPSTSDILQVLVDNKGKDIYFDAGNYDVIAIYKAHYGDDFFDNYVGYSTDPLCRGIPVYRGTTMKFSPNARFTANYSGDNANVRQNFSAFAFESGVTFDGLNIVASGIRNIIHDDFDNSYVGNTVIKNCHFVHDYIIIAGGMAVHEIVEIYNNYFERTDTTSHVFDFSYHQNEASGAQSELIIKDNYCSKGISIRYYGNSTLVTDCLISNNSIANAIEYRAENSSATIQNMRILKWNNEIRS